MRSAALQHVREISASATPSHADAEAFERAVEEIAHASRHLLEDLVTSAPPRDRAVAAERAHQRAADRCARSG